MLVFTFNVNAQSFFEYKFAVADNKISIDSKTKDVVLKVFQKKLVDYKYTNAKCLYDSAAKLFIVHSDSSIELGFLTNVLMRYSKNGFEMYELYNQKEILQIIDDNKTTKIPLFVNPPAKYFENYNKYNSAIAFKDTAALAKDILQYKSKLPADIIFAYGKTKEVNQKYIEIYYLKNNKNKFVTKGFIDTVSFGQNENGFIKININLSEKGKIIFANLTKQNIQRGIAMVINNTVLTAPIVTSEIEGGKLEISGGLNYEEASEIVSILKEENLPIKLKFVKSEIVKK